MGKTTRILQLVNLLISRECVTLDNIRTICNIPNRTVYRYLNWISEADIPVYYDKETQAYRLSRSRKISLDEISTHEGVLLVTSLKAMSAHVNEEYRGDLERLMTKVLVRQQLPLDGDFTQALGNSVAKGRDPDYTVTLATAMVTAAVATGRPIRLSMTKKDGQSWSEEIAEPRLTFSGEWGVSENRETGEQATQLSSVSKVTLL
jgi:predicted DNA-binding transcriptional regulator YafY